MGEKSTLDIENFHSKESNMALAAKDSSIVRVKNAEIYNSNFCLSAYQKKQEFGGAFIQAKKIDCEGKNFYDKNSLISF